MIFGTALRWQREEEEQQHKKRRKSRGPKRPAKNGSATQKSISEHTNQVRQTTLFPFTPEEAPSSDNRTQKKQQRTLSGEENGEKDPRHNQPQLPLFNDLESEETD